MGNINLFDLYNKGFVKDGGHDINVPIKKANGEKYSGKTYAIPLKYLYYNEQNGRIGVTLSNYESTNGKLSPGHNEEYNMIVQNMLTNDDDKTKKDMEVLKRDIAMKGQDQPGYVLSDGRVIDGNRRFTARRLLDQDPAIIEQQYFEAVILDDLSVENIDDRKRIKSLELQIQFGRLDKVDYDPIDRAIDAHKTVSVNTIMTATEYAKFAGLKPNEVNNLLLEAELIVKFLEFSNTNPDNYALAKQLELDGPLRDLLPQYKKFKNTANTDQLLNSLFAKIIQVRSAKEDYKQEFRQIVKTVVGTKNEEKFIEEMEESTDTIVEALDNKEPIKNNVELFSRLHHDQEAVQAIAEVQKISNKHSEKSKNRQEQNMPAKLADKAITTIESIDKRIVQGLPKAERQKLNESLGELRKQIDVLLSMEG
ncbi:RNA polymerase subunit sigma-70 [Bacillus thuringiensis]|uniref:RNA polymerase subunit sigma-70 n=1 Tax=Bacillus thuringiensis TaxID=1428 RepID=A0AAW9GHB1_BACTU|nr:MULTISPECIES: RNA polymerase subunit sigma-70 [Bacillus cereus group]MDA1782326.1 RNA polymerase subunit sigma-70 [Bacillus cereus]MDY0851996.1 RNA polymerase subunit sigma-70 [Bacillus thuringiensis]MDY4391493.1 RNA polymerase subunit sigma-70 [Bacillus thuringiensis]MDZ4535348.1 RNA polymerase subunit sigma-70 [Bacillus cereus]